MTTAGLALDDVHTKTEFGLWIGLVALSVADAATTAVALAAGLPELNPLVAGLVHQAGPVAVFGLKAAYLGAAGAVWRSVDGDSPVHARRSDVSLDARRRQQPRLVSRRGRWTPMSQVASAPHECEGNLVYVGDGLSPYWAVGSLCLSSFDGHSGEIELEIDGEEWTVNLKYQKGGIAPRPTDDVGGDRLYEYRIGAYGDGERKANFLIQPRFPSMRHYETGDQISSPFDNADPDEARLNDLR